MILFRNVTKQFDESFALDELNFAIEPGELVMLTGPSGSGKTTIMRLLMREYMPTTGEILFDDTPLTKISRGQIHHHRRKIGVIFQDYKLLPDLNVWENIALALSIINTKDSEIERRVTDLLELVSLSDKAFLFPTQLSGGEAQRVSIARALSTAPKVIFADEPTGNLDPDTSKNIISLLKKINEMGTTVMITTHNHDVRNWLGTVRHIELEKGKLIKDSKMSKKDETTKQETKTSDDIQKEDVKTKKSSGNSFWSWLPFSRKNKKTTSDTEPDSSKTEDTEKKESQVSNQKKSDSLSKSKKKKADLEEKESIEIAIEDL